MRAEFRFYDPTTGAFVRRSPAEGSVLNLPSGASLGGFPREGGEPFSWYVCGCDDPSIASRASSLDSLTCPHCGLAPDEPLLCGCGIASDAGGETYCPACGRAKSAHTHDCPEADLVVHLTGNRCPICAQASSEDEPRPSADKPQPGGAKTQTKPTPVSVAPSPAPASPSRGPAARLLPIAGGAVAALLLVAAIWAVAGASMPWVPEPPAKRSVAPAPSTLDGIYVGNIGEGVELLAATLVVDDERWTGNEGQVRFWMRTKDGSLDSQRASLWRQEDRVSICLETEELQEARRCGSAVVEGGRLVLRSDLRLTRRSAWEFKKERDENEE